ncbi:hypothetical protein SBV1_2420025 [Verrucomicrobia bacterium]|nr:hypothetical protein SBV1_2420025 [Verrucomicrobiota bacterium]
MAFESGTREGTDPEAKLHQAYEAGFQPAGADCALNPGLRCAAPSYETGHWPWAFRGIGPILPRGASEDNRA